MKNPTANMENILKLSLFAIDDNPTTLRLYENYLSDHIKSITLLENPEAAIKRIKKSPPNLIIVDFTQKDRSGLELIKSIRKIDKKTPIILCASAQDNANIFDIVNTHITHSLKKPFDKETLLKSVNAAVQNSNLLTEKDNEYNNLQQQRAFLKEHQSIKNDFYYKYYLHPDEKTIWFLDGSYRPHDILSGDTYSIRYLKDKSCFLFVIDAMGKGVSASVTSILASSYINHLIDTQEDKFEFESFVQKFNDYIIKNLLDEEVLSVVFAQLDFVNETLKVSSFSMPPILLCDAQNNITKIKANNQPISKYNTVFNVQTQPLNETKKMLFCSDGLVESTLENGELYFSHLKQDFQNSKSRSSFLKKVYEKVANPDDDITLLFIQKMDVERPIDVHIKCSTRLKEVEKIITGFHDYLEKNEVDNIHTAKLGMIFSEMIINAYEHGNLGISNLEKKELISKGDFHDICQKKEAQYAQKNISVNYTLTPHGEGKDLRFDITDEGEGFDTKIFKKLVFDHTSVNGRGFKIAKKMVDAIYYSPKGNHVILHKYIPKEF